MNISFCKLSNNYNNMSGLNRSGRIDNNNNKDTNELNKENININNNISELT